MRTPEFQPSAFQKLEKQKFLAKLIPFLLVHLEDKSDAQLEAARAALENERQATSKVTAETREEVQSFLDIVENDIQGTKQKKIPRFPLQ